MGVGRYTPNTAVMGDMGWESVEVRQWDSIINHRHRLRSMTTTALISMCLYGPQGEEMVDSKIGAGECLVSFKNVI